MKLLLIPDFNKVEVTFNSVFSHCTTNQNPELKIPRLYWNPDWKAISPIFCEEKKSFFYVKNSELEAELATWQCLIHRLSGIKINPTVLCSTIYARDSSTLSLILFFLHLIDLFFFWRIFLIFSFLLFWKSGHN